MSTYDRRPKVAAAGGRSFEDYFEAFVSNAVIPIVAVEVRGLGLAAVLDDASDDEEIRFTITDRQTGDEKILCGVGNERGKLSLSAFSREPDVAYVHQDVPANTPGRTIAKLFSDAIKAKYRAGV